MSSPATYEIVRFSRGERGQRVMRTGLTLEEARAHCQDPKTRGEHWFDGFRNTDPASVLAYAERSVAHIKALVNSGEVLPSPVTFRERVLSIPMLPDVED